MTSKFVKMGYFTPLQPPRSILSPLSILKLRQEGHSGHFPNRYRYRSPSGPLDAPGCQGKEPLRLLRRLPTVTRVREVRDQPTNIWRPGVRRVGDQPTNPGPGVQIFGWQLGKTPGCRPVCLADSAWLYVSNIPKQRRPKRLEAATANRPHPPHRMP